MAMTPKVDISIDDSAIVDKEANYAILKVGYDKYVLPLSKALAIIDGLSVAETYDTNDWSNPVIKPMKELEFELSIIGPDKYKELKVKYLLLQKKDEV